MAAGGTAWEKYEPCKKCGARAGKPCTDLNNPKMGRESHMPHTGRHQVK